MALFCQEESWLLMGAFCKGTPTCLPQCPAPVTTLVSMLSWGQ